jgi:hypothetical protein
LSVTSKFSKSRAPDLPLELDDGLVLRQATLADIEEAAEFIERIHSSQSLGVSIRDLMCGDHPTTSASDFVLITDSRANQRIVAMAGLLSQTWAYDGIPFDIGNPEFVSTDPAYRRRGLMRTVMDGLHAVSAVRGHLLQALQGLRWFYRQFGYEYALNPGPRRQLQLSEIPPLPDGKTEPYQIRRITQADIPLIMPLYRRQCVGSLITTILDEDIRQHDISGYSPGSDLGDWTFAITDPDGQFVGCFSTWGDPWGAFVIKELSTTNDALLTQVLSSVLRFIQSHKVTYAAEFEDESPPSIKFDLGINHLAYKILDTQLGQPQPRQDWYIRVPDLPKFIRHITSVLERRLEKSELRNFTGELKITFFQGGLRLIFDHGKLSETTNWKATGENKAFNMTCFPPLVFLKLLFGYRSLEELCYAYPDCWANEGDTHLLNVLFPKQPSWLRML